MPNFLGKSYSRKKNGRSDGFAGMLLLSLESGTFMFVFPARNGLLTRHEWAPGRQKGSVFRSIPCYLVGNGPRAFFPGGELYLC